jgi:hypothetical protein
MMFRLPSFVTLRRSLTCGLLGLAVAGVAQAQTKPCVVELFTSQGCSSCPPADAVLAELAKVPGVIALSLPVDYWDYIGWKDTLASPHFTARQKAYANARGDGRVYTPQAVVDGIVHVVGSDQADIAHAADNSFGRSGAMTVPVDVSASDGHLNISVGGGPAEAGRAGSVWLVRVVRSRTVKVGRGENRGKTLTYTNVVRSQTRLGDWTGAAARFEAPVSDAVGSDADGVVILVQAGSDSQPGVILGAAAAP